MKQEFKLTQDNLDKLKQELEYLKTVRMQEVAEQIKEARSFGDLSENAEYDAAKDEQAEVEARISQIEYMLKYAKVVEDEGEDIVTVGKKVTLEIFGEEQVYQIVGTSEADPYKNKLSHESPIGAACLNHTAGETVQAMTPGGEVKFKILKIEK